MRHLGFLLNWKKGLIVICNMLSYTYKEFIRDYISQGHTYLVTAKSSCYENLEETYFLRHHDVIKPSSSTTKLSTAFNGSSRTSNGYSLNDLLFTGPKFLPELPDLISNLRFYRFVFVVIFIKCKGKFKCIRRMLGLRP